MPIVTLPNGQLRDEIRQPLYDTLDIGNVSPVATRTFFTTGSSVPRSIAKTNVQDNKLDAARSFRIQGLCLDAHNFDVANAGVLSIYLEKASIQLFVGEKNYWQGPARFACGRMEQSYGAATTVAATTLQQLRQQYGWSAVQPVIFQGKHVVDVNPLQRFYCEFAVAAADVTAGEITSGTPAAGTVVSFVFSLKGLLRRPVQ